MIAQARDWLADVMSPRSWRVAIAILASALAVAALSGGLVWWYPWLQIGLVAGVVVGLIAPGGLDAVLAALVGTAIGLALGPTTSLATVPLQVRVIQGALTLAVAASAAPAVRALARRGRWAAPAMTYIAVAVMVGNLWATTLEINTHQTFDPQTQSRMPSMNEQLRGSLPPDYEGSDHVLFMRVYRAVAQGEDYYESFANFMVQGTGLPPSSVFNVRFPLITYVWSSLPNPSWIVFAYLALASAAVVSLVPLNAGIVRAPLVLPASAVLAAYFLSFSMRLFIFTTETWAVALAVLSLAAYSRSTRSTRWKTLTVAAVAFAVVAVLVRETLVFVLIGGLVSSILSRGPERRFRVLAWAAGIVLVLAAYTVHYSFAADVVDATSSFQQFDGGSISRVISALTFGTEHLGGGGVFAFVLAALGIAGMLLMPDKRIRVAVAIATLVPLASFFFVSNMAIDDRTGIAFNYWGAAVVPILYACIPVVFSLLPGAARRTAQEPGAAA